LLFSILAIVSGANSYRGICTFIKVHRRKLNKAFRLGAADTVKKALDRQIRIKTEDRIDGPLGFLLHPSDDEPTLPVGAPIVHANPKLFALETRDVFVLAGREVKKGKAVGEGGDDFAPRPPHAHGEGADAARNLVTSQFVSRRIVSRNALAENVGPEQETVLGRPE
jgi:hypothetical protein